MILLDISHRNAGSAESVKRRMRYKMLLRRLIKKANPYIDSKNIIVYWQLFSNYLIWYIDTIENLMQLINMRLEHHTLNLNNKW